MGRRLRPFSTAETEKLEIYIPRDLKRRFKVAVAMAGTSMTVAGAEAIEVFTAQIETAAAQGEEVRAAMEAAGVLRRPR